MAVRLILNSTSPILRSRCRPVKAINRPMQRLLDDMAETMYDAPGVGLAAPQVGVAKQLIVADAGDKRLLQLVNPRIVEASGGSIEVEGCLSLPGVYGEVPRAAAIVVEALDRSGEAVRLSIDGLLARILQHEIDHLHGILFIDRAIKLVDPAEMKGEENR